MNERKDLQEQGRQEPEEKPRTLANKLMHALMWTAIFYGLWLLSVKLLGWATGMDSI